MVQPAYDAVGNATTVPQPGNWAASHTLVWDAWNRLVGVPTTSPSSTAYQYDALFRRIVITEGSTPYDYYHTDQWQVSEVYNGSGVEWSAFWGIRDLNDLIKREGAGYPGGTLYALREKLNIVAVVDETTSNVVQRFAYDTFGQARFLTPAFASGSNTYSWNFLFHGYELDEQTAGFYAVRYRTYHPTLGRWPNRDPIGEEGGNNLYSLLNNDAINDFDVFGERPFLRPPPRLPSRPGGRPSRPRPPRTPIDPTIPPVHRYIGDPPIMTGPGTQIIQHPYPRPIHPPFPYIPPSPYPTPTPPTPPTPPVDPTLTPPSGPECKPCTPPAGTIQYQVHTDHTHFDKLTQCTLGRN